MCIFCSSNLQENLYHGILKCKNCGHISADLRIDEDELIKYYDRGYFSGVEYINYAADKKLHQKKFKTHLKIIKKFIDPIRHKNIFEIGCAYGFFLDTAQKYFDTVSGIDISEDGIRYAQEKLNLNVIQGDFLKHDFGEQKFDIVCMWDTIEHLFNPRLFLDKINKHTESGALLALTTGDIESLNARMRKGKWRFIKPPEHIHFFSKKTLADILNNYGFDIIYNRYSGFYARFDDIAYELFVQSKKAPWLYNLLHNIPLSKCYFYLNLYDIMYVIARKR